MLIVQMISVPKIKHGSDEIELIQLEFEFSVG